MLKLAILLAIPAALLPGPAAAQTPTPEDSADAIEQAAGFTASPALVKALLAEVPGITATQAQGAAGALFTAAKATLSAADFDKVSAAVPNMADLLAAAPSPDPRNVLHAVAGKEAGSSPAMIGAAGAMTRVGLKPGQIAGMTQALVKAVEAKGGSEAGALLAGALK